MDLEDRIEEIEVTNHALLGRGTFRVCEDGGVSWEYWGSFDSARGADHRRHGHGPAHRHRKRPGRRAAQARAGSSIFLKL